jgi:hypothetical protein
MPFDVVLQEASITSHSPLIAVHPQNGGVLTGEVTATINGTYRIVPIIRSATNKGWVGGFSLGGSCIGDTCTSSGTFNFTVDVRRWIPTGQFTLELVVLPVPGAWSDQHLVTDAVPFIVTAVNANAVGGQLAAGATNPPNIGDTGDQSSGSGVVIALVVVGAVVTLAFGSVWVKHARNVRAADKIEPMSSLGHGAPTTTTTAVTTL